MKKILALFAAFSLSSAYAQKSQAHNDSSVSALDSMLNIQKQEARAPDDQRHMIEFNAQTLPSLIYSITNTKTNGSDSDNDHQTSLSLNYAYALHPNFQIGGRFNYFNGTVASSDTERMDLQLGGWFNLKGGDLQNSAYVSFHLGAGYAQTFGTSGGRDDLVLSTLAVGKRTSMHSWGVRHMTWSPEIALTSTNSTTDSSFDYRQALEFRLIQFSVIW